MIEIPEDCRILQVKRGNHECLVPVPEAEVDRTLALDCASLAIRALLLGQMQEPGRASDPIQTDDTQLALQVDGRDEPLDPDLPIGPQLEGCWSTASIRRAEVATPGEVPVCRLRLVNVRRPAIFR